MANQEKFKTSIGGQALIEGILMRGPEKDAIVIRGSEGDRNWRCRTGRSIRKDSGSGGP